jgi:hypothetical protein
MGWKSRGLASKNSKGVRCAPLVDASHGGKLPAVFENTLTKVKSRRARALSLGTIAVEVSYRL